MSRGKIPSETRGFLATASYRESREAAGLIACFLCLIALLFPWRAKAQTTGAAQGSGTQGVPPGPALTLEDLEKMALQHNPAVAQAEASVRAAQARVTQAGLYPNPTVGYDGDEISGGSIGRGGEHGVFVQQTIVTAGKLGLARKVRAEEQAEAEARATAARYGVLNKVRALYYETLAAERLVEVRGRLAEITTQAVSTSKQLLNVGEADQADLLEAEIEQQRAALDLDAAKNDQERVWRQLASAVGNPALKPVSLSGKLDAALPELDRETALETVLRESPEVKMAEAGVERAKTALKRARVAKIPDVQFRAGLRDNLEKVESLPRPFGLEGFAEIGVELPFFNRNQGNVKSAEAEMAGAQQEVDRVKLSLRSRFAPAFRDYLDSVATARTFQNELLPRAQKAYELYLNKYKQMAAAYPQVLIAQRTLFQLQENYVAALVRLWRAIVAIRGLLLFDTDQNGSGILNLKSSIPRRPRLG